MQENRRHGSKITYHVRDTKTSMSYFVWNGHREKGFILPKRTKMTTFTGKEIDDISN